MNKKVKNPIKKKKIASKKNLKPDTHGKNSASKKRSEKYTNFTIKSDFPIVGIGASAGGLEALEGFFQNMPKNNGMAFVVIQHLDPTHTGMLPELLQRVTPMKVHIASDGLKVSPDCIYVIPPNKSLSILKGKLHLFEPVESRGLRLPVDFFFRSLATDRLDQSIGIVLSGMGSDGSLGLKAIKEQNGTVIVQDPATAKFDGMPRSAIDSVIADIVAPVEELPAKLINYLKYVPAVVADHESDQKNISILDKIIILLRDQCGHDFSLYKKNTLLRRIERRKGIHHLDNMKAYLRFLMNNPRELDILFKELLIGVTSFFRDPDVWEKLKKNVLPELLAEFPPGYIVRAWVPGCSTGEEAYSLAITFKEILEKTKNHKNISIQIFATDLDPDAIDSARKGYYPANIVADISAERLKKYFTVENENFHVNGNIREMVVFAQQNVIKDPPFTKLDFLSCRNMLIYMESELQKKLFNLFHYSLNPGGIMVLGSSETIGIHNDGFNLIDNKQKIFKRTSAERVNELIDFPSAFSGRRFIPSIKYIEPKTTGNIQSLADSYLLLNYAPASVLVNENGDIVYITGRTGKYLEPPSGKTNWNIHAMARAGLRNELPMAFRQARKNFEPVILHNIKVGTNGGTQYVDLTVVQLENPEPLRGMVMVVFKDVPDVSELPRVSGKDLKPSLKQKELEKELQRSYEEVQNLREEMQASQEEMQTSQEEMQSTNEELQSTNEELTTSKEEMQSLNEELQTVNNELQSRINDFVEADNDMKNLLNSTEIATLFLDRKLNIRRFTDSITNIYKMRKADIGRPFTDVVTGMIFPEIESDAHLVLKNLAPVEKSIETNDKKWFNVRIIPYRTSDDRIDGLVITFTDITKAKNIEIELIETNKKLQEQIQGLS